MLILNHVSSEVSKDDRVIWYKRFFQLYEILAGKIIFFRAKNETDVNFISNIDPVLRFSTLQKINR